METRNGGIMKELVQIQARLKAPKGQQNNFGKYKYRSCEDILEAAKPLLLEFLCLLTCSDDIVLIGDRYYIKATYTITNPEKESISVSGFARESFEKKGMDTSQITGATSSYSRKYALNGLFAIDDTKDADTQDNRTKAPKMPTRASISGELLEIDNIKDFNTYSLNFVNEHGKGVWTMLSGKRGNQTETWKDVFSTAKDRINGVPIVNAKLTPDQIEAEWASIAGSCSDLETVTALESNMNNNKCLQTPENKKILDTLYLAYGGE